MEKRWCSTCNFEMTPVKGRYLCLRCGRQDEVGQDTTKEREALNAAQEIFRQNLTLETGATHRAYLDKRGILQESIDEYGIGCGWGQGHVKDLLLAQGFSEETLLSAGLISRFKDKQTGEEKTACFLDGRITFPLKDPFGQIIGFSGRTIREGVPNKYINPTTTALYHKREHIYGLSEAIPKITEKKTVILVEGELDVVASSQIGIKNVAAIKGSVFSEQHARLISKYAQTAYLMFDPDAAGMKALVTAIFMLLAWRVMPRIVRLGDLDPGDLAIQKPDELKRRIIGAHDLTRFCQLLPDSEDNWAMIGKIMLLLQGVDKDYYNKFRDTFLT